MATTKEIEAAFAVAQQELRWSINKIPLVRRMLEAAERERAEERHVAGNAS